jgi:glycosyltransferase involved in cell wall biosynthesis
MMFGDSKIHVSVVTPVYAGADYLEELVVELAKLRESWEADTSPVDLTEAIMVDDSARDGSSALLDALAERYDWLRIVRLARNFGQHPATIAGILHASGDWIVTLDEDLQHPPQNIPLLFQKVVGKTCDVVYANAKGAVHNRWYRDWTAKLFKALMMRVTGNPFIGRFNSFRLIRGSVARAAASVCSHETYFDIALCWFTQHIESVGMELKDPRLLSGKKSGYSFRQLLSHARRMVMSTRTNLLRAGGVIGLGSMGIAVVYGIVIIVQKLVAPETVDVRGWTSLFLAILFFGGTVSFLVGTALEYLSVILLHAQGKPTFFAVVRTSDAYLTDYFGDSKV